MENLTIELVALLSGLIGVVVTVLAGKVKEIVLKTETKIDDQILEALEAALRKVLEEKKK